MAFSEVLEKYPETAKIMLKHGLHCIGCHVAAFESVEQGCLGHGMSSEAVDNMIKEMNSAIKQKK
ncbi:MAG: DUF1858 domain-containing protein [Nanoarchaeota archaeon]|nr:DUF1858 domain-containing protein [Nanoarchaeota archaeon]MBU1005866.1 DUF1858 domain-containing protein [Nanoarchaeota archaeon]